MDRIMYLRDSYKLLCYSTNNFSEQPGQPVGCVFIRVYPGKNEAWFNLSVCHPKDRFDRKIARRSAERNYLNEAHRVGLSPAPSRHDISRAVMQAIAAGNFPARAVRSAKLWLKTVQVRTGLEPLLWQAVL